MTEPVRFRCQSCGAELLADSADETVQCAYCGASFILPDQMSDPAMYSKTFQSGYDVENDPALKEAIQWINEKGSREHVSFSDFGTSLKCRVNDRGMEYIGRLYNLENLVLMLSKLSGRGLEKISALTKLRKLDLEQTGLQDADIQYILPLKNLEYLSLESNEVTDACVEYLEKLPNLEHINIKYTDIEAEGYVRLASLPNMRKVELNPHMGGKKFPLFRAGLAHKCLELRDVYLVMEKMTDDDLQYLKDIDSIRALNLAGNNIEGPGLQYLTGMKRLMSLDLSLNYWLGNEALAPLLELPRLRVLNLKMTGVTEEGIKILREKNPRMQIKVKTFFAQFSHSPSGGTAESDDKEDTVPVQKLRRRNEDRRRKRNHGDI